MRIELKAESQLTESERHGLARLSAEAFPPDGDDTQWAQSDWHVLVWEDDEIVSHVEIVERTATVGGQPKGRKFFTDPIMILPVCKQEWPYGEIDLCGRPW